MDELATQIGLGAGAFTIAIFCFIGLTFAVSIGFSIWLIKYIRKSFYGNQDVLDHGHLVQATILKSWQTGAMVNYNPQIGLRLQVQPANGQPYEVETKAVVPQLKLVMLQEGAMIPVKIDPNDRMRVALAI